MNQEFLLNLLKIPSPSGHEERIKDFVTSFLQGKGIQAEDLGSRGLSWEVGGGEDLSFFTAHIDQVSMIVERIDDEGYIYFKMPGVDHRILPSQEILVSGRRDLKGIIGMRPPHFVSEAERQAVIPREKLYIDVGLPPDEVKKDVHIGDACTWFVEPVSLVGRRVTGTGLDNKASLFLALLLTEKLSSRKLSGRVRFFASTQEEASMLGAASSGRNAEINREKVCFAVVADVTFGTSYGVSDFSFPLGKGPTLGVGPILSRKHLEILRQIARELSVPYSLEPLGRTTGTEADVLSLSGEGIPSVLISIPLRYMHSPVEIIDLADVEYSLELLVTAFERKELWNA